MFFPIWVAEFARRRQVGAADFKHAKVELLRALKHAELDRANELLRVIDPTFSIQSVPLAEKMRAETRARSAWELDYADLEKRHVAEWLLAEGGAEIGLSLGFAPREIGAALRQVELSFKLKMEGLRCRIGVTRGHLLEVIVAFPLDLELSPQQLEIAGEELVSRTLGDRFCDDWLAHVDVIQIARTRGLLMVNDDLPAAQTYPISELASLAQRGAALILKEVEQHHALEANKEHSSYTALEIPPGRKGALQPERVYASTSDPEALKAVLEGLPFSSHRFRRDGSLFFYLSFASEGTAEERLAVLQKVEDALLRALQPSLKPSGRGFSSRLQYFDFFLLHAEENLPALLEQFQALRSDLNLFNCSVGHYDSSFRSVSYEVIS